MIRERAIWDLAGPPPSYELGHVRAVLPGRVLDDARVVVRDGRIADVAPHPPGTTASVDGGGLLCLPGLVDVHTDGLEVEAQPRPGARLPWDDALAMVEGRLLAAGITTAFHGAGFEESTPGAVPQPRSVAAARELCAAVDAAEGRVDHRVLHRLDVRSPEGLAALEERLGALTGCPLVSCEDHTPGLGQYVDRRRYEEHLAGTRGLDAAGARAAVDRLVDERERRATDRDVALDRLGRAAREGRIRLLGHDPVDEADIAALAGRGGCAAEFPTTLAAARAAHERGLPVVAGAPNALRGGSHSGNVAVAQLADAGVLTALASDYLPAALLPAALRLAGPLGLPAAVALVTSGPAAVAGLPDRGALLPGLRADLTLVAPGRFPAVRAVLSSARGRR